MHAKSEYMRTYAIPQHHVGMLFICDSRVFCRLQKEIEEFHIVVLQSKSVGRNMESKGHLKQKISTIPWRENFFWAAFDELFDVTVLAQLHSNILEADVRGSKTKRFKRPRNKRINKDATSQP